MVFVLVNVRDKNFFEVQGVGLFFCFWGKNPTGQGLLINEISRSHTMTYHRR